MADLYDMPGHLVRRYHQAAVAIFHHEVGALGIDITPVQFAALSKIETHPGIDQATLAGLIGYDRTTIAGVVDRLERKGLLAREVSGRDRRARVLRLTRRGGNLLRRMAPAVEAAQAIMLQGLDETEVAEFVRLLRKATLAVNALSRAPLKRSTGNPG